MQEYRNRLAFVTGGASGIGLAIGRALAAAGMRVALADIDEDKLCHAARAVPGALAIRLDVRDRQAWTSALDTAEAAFGPLAVLISNAGVAGSRLPLAQTPVEAWRWTTGINLDGTFNAISLGAPRLLAGGGIGHIVATASLGALLVRAGNGVYSATKAGVVALCEALRDELAGSPVGVSVLCPGLVRSELIEANAARAPASIELGRHEPELAAAMRDALDPAVVGALAVEAIRQRRFWLFTHPETRDAIAARHREIDTAMA